MNSGGSSYFTYSGIKAAVPLRILRNGTIIIAFLTDIPGEKLILHKLRPIKIYLTYLRT
jgi:hypothetical protein